MLQKYIMCIMAMSFMFLSACSKFSEKSGSSNDISDTQPQETPIKEQHKVEETLDGIYTYDDNSAKLEMKIAGDQWVGKTVVVSGFGEVYDEQNATIDQGIVRGNELYDSSGYSRIGTISGQSIYTSVSNQRVVLSKI